MSAAREIDINNPWDFDVHPTAEWVSDTVFITFQNSTDYYIAEIIVEVTVKDAAGNVLSDETYRATPDPGTGSSVAPGSKGYFQIYTGNFPGGTWNWSIVGARGVKD
ncbi:MAG: hypothetical protein KGM47_16975 [Acidobacteriota bacterium]|nr:hypothetical protein [Acidobacteriota bacterium]